MLKYKYATMEMIGAFEPAPDPAEGQPRKPEMEGVERIELRNGAGGLTGHIAYSVDSPTGTIGVLPGEWLAKDEDGAVHVMTTDARGGYMDKSNGAGPYVDDAPAPKAKAKDDDKGKGKDESKSIFKN